MKKLYCIPNKEEIDEFLAFSTIYNAGFEYNDFFVPALLDDPQWVAERIGFYKALDRDRSDDTLHGVFLDICVNSDDPKIFQVSNERIHQSMEIGKQLGVKAVIFHTNMIPNFSLKQYQNTWLDRNEKYWRALLREYNTMEIYMENMFDEEPHLLRMLAERLRGEKRFGICFDLAHAFISGTPIDSWIDTIGLYAKHLHINDNMGLEDTHCPVGAGEFPWQDYQTYIEQIPESSRPTVLLEVRGIKDLLSSALYMERKGLYPINNTTTSEGENQK